MHNVSIFFRPLLCFLSFVKKAPSRGTTLSVLKNHYQSLSDDLDSHYQSLSDDLDSHYQSLSDDLDSILFSVPSSSAEKKSSPVSRSTSSTVRTA